MGRPIGDLAQGVNLSDKHLQAIGLVAVRWAELEHSIKELVWELANIRFSSALATTAHINETTLVNIANSLVDLLVTGPENQLAHDITAHLNTVVNKIYPKRNAMVHSTFGISHLPGKTQIFSIKARGKLKYGPRENFSADDIFDIAQEIYEANLKLYKYISKLRDLIPTWRHIAKSSK